MKQLAIGTPSGCHGCRALLTIPFALLLLGAIYAIPDGDRAIAAPIYGGALLLTSELAFWSLDERVHQRVQPGTFTPRLLGILAVSVGAIPLSASHSSRPKPTCRDRRRPRRPERRRS
jgi:hypothetical protein